MEKRIKFHGYSIINFEMKKKEKISKREKVDTEINIEILKNDNDSNIYKAIMKVKVTSEYEEINLSLEGVFEFPPASEEISVENFLKYSAPSILYPYCRSFISMVTGFDNGETLILPIINFYE